jgi:LIVCS family branched-chain amino acid:cation transporter
MQEEKNSYPWYQPIFWGGALFSMFFGAGNMVYSLWVGYLVDRQNYWPGVLGFILTAVLFPLIGLLGISSQRGCVFSFMAPISSRAGKIALLLLILCVWGPFGAIPRAIAMTNKSMGLYLPQMPEGVAHAIWAILVVFLVTNPKQLVNAFGKFLMPALILSSISIFIVSLWHPSALAVSSFSIEGMAMEGINMGYQTMDGLAAIFFGKLMVEMFAHEKMPKKAYKRFFSATFFTALLMLVAVYLMLIEASARLTEEIVVSSPVMLMVEMSRHALGPWIGFVVALLMTCAALSTAIALQLIMADFIHVNILPKVKRNWIVIGCMSIAYGLSLLGFEGIKRLSEPFLQVLYPSLLLISLYLILLQKPLKKWRDEPHLIEEDIQ